MKDLFIAVFAVLIFLISLLAISFEFMALIDPEKPKNSQHFVFIATAVTSFLISRFLWKLSKQK